MKTTIVTVLISSAILATSNALTIPNPPGNIVQNWTFQDWSFNYWTGLGAIIGSPESAPNAIYGWSGDAYQDLTTTPGQQYSLDFWAAADLYIAPRVTITVDLNHQPLTSYTTPPYPYNPTINRSAQMHWEEFTSLLTASAATTRLEFVGDVYAFGFTAVSVVPVPEPASIALLFAACAAIVAMRRRPRPNHPAAGNAALAPGLPIGKDIGVVSYHLSFEPDALTEKWSNQGGECQSRTGSEPVTHLIHCA
jgi:hypothetical protein